MTRVLLVNPPFKGQFGRFSREQRSPGITKSGTLYYPMWLCYATGLLEKNDCCCKLIDAPAADLTRAQLLALAVDFKPDLIVVDTSTPSIYNDVEIAVELKRQTRAPVVLVGTHPSAMPQEVLAIDDEIDAVAVGEYEHTLCEVAARLAAGKGQGQDKDKDKDKKTFGGVAGLVYRCGDSVVANPPRPMCEDIDSLPFVSEVYKKHLDHTSYFYSHSRYPIVTIVTARGCPFKCFYCVYPQVFAGHSVRTRSIADVVDEIEYILDNFPDVKEIMFEDDTLTLNKKRSMAFAGEILRRGLKFKWSANSRADVDLETMRALKSAGARLFCVGVESGVQAILDNLQKNLKVDRIREFFRDAKRAGILVHGCFLVGGPGETKQSLEQTLAFARELRPDTAQFFPIMVYPGTRAYTWAVENGFLKADSFDQWLTNEGMHNCVVSRPGLTDEDLVEFCDRARRAFYLSAGYITRKLISGVRHPSELKRLIRGARHLLTHLNTDAPGKRERADSSEPSRQS